jgi:acyl carrier protein
VNNNEDNTDNASTATVTAELNNKSNDVGLIVQRVDYGNIATSFTCIETIHRAVEQYASSSTHANSIFAEYVAPCSELEQQLCDIWQDLLNVERVGIKDNFFELGGHSLLATRMVVKINQKLNVSLRLDKIFKAQTIAALSDVIEAQQLILNIQTNNDADISSNEMELTI